MNAVRLAVLASLAALACSDAARERAASAPPAPATPAEAAAAPAATQTARQAVAVPECQVNGNGPNGFVANKQLFFGELHSHTAFSLDAFSFGTRNAPADAYLFAKGTPLQIGTGTNGPPGPIIQPRRLDFAAVTDHAEFLAVVSGCVVNTDSGYYLDNDCFHVRSQNPARQDSVFPMMGAIVKNICKRPTSGPRQGDFGECIAQQQFAWQVLQNAANNANQACDFTAFVAYEWSGQETYRRPLDATNHRNVIFKNEFVPPIPFDFVAARTPRELWGALDQFCNGECDAVTIPHNTNISAGLSLQIWDSSPNGIRLQTHYQVSAEIYQHKGGSECHYDPAAAFAEAECSFEQFVPGPRDVPLLPTSFLRAGLSAGLAYEAAHAGENPFKLGFVAASDGHNAAPGDVGEDTWQGHDGRVDDTAVLRLEDRPDWSPGGITGAWAEENTRTALFAAIRRRETYGTSGPRLRVRVLQSTNQTSCLDVNYPSNILPGAKPMGSTLHDTDLGGLAPSFAIEAWPDSTPQAVTLLPTPRVAGIDRVQVIKIYRDGSTGNIVTATPIDATGGAGFPAMGGCVNWTDPSFDAAQPALYYVRVLQELTKRWTQHACDAIVGTPEWTNLCGPGTAINVEPIEERAWTSPIWYEPPPPPPPQP